METAKARARRMKEGFFEKYIVGRGIDIGCGNDPITDSCDTWDFPQGDATFMVGVPPQAYDWIHSSHCLEDLQDYQLGMKNWWKILRPGGYLILLLPHRDLFERRRTLPSAGNKNHKWFFLIDRDEPPCTVGLVPMIGRLLPGAEIEYVRKCDAGYTCEFRPNENFADGYQVIANGEFSIEAVIKKQVSPYIYVEEHAGGVR